MAKQQPANDTEFSTRLTTLEADVQKRFKDKVGSKHSEQDDMLLEAVALLRYVANAVTEVTVS